MKKKKKVKTTLEKLAPYNIACKFLNNIKHTRKIHKKNLISIKRMKIFYPIFYVPLYTSPITISQSNLFSEHNLISNIYKVNSSFI